MHSSYRQFALQLEESMSDDFATLFKRILHFAVFARVPQVSGQVTSKFGAWEWV